MIRDRVVGAETEYGIVVKTKHKGYNSIPEESKRLERLFRRYKNIVGWSFRSPNIIWISPGERLWFQNGACAYRDMSCSEYASPECRRIQDAIAQIGAGDRIMARLCGTPEKNGSRLILVKNNKARDYYGSPSTYGFHENYLSFSKDWSADNYRPIIPFLVTRQIFDGAGGWSQEDGGIFFFSQRALFIEEEIGEIYNKRTILTKRGEHTSHVGGRKDMHRLHLTLGDSNILDTSLFLKLGTTSLVLSLFENHAVPKIKIEDAVTAIQELSFSCDVKKKIYLAAGKSMTALAIQEAFCDAARKLVERSNFESEESEAEARKIVSLWEDALTALATNDMAWMAGRLDWATKRLLVEQEIKTYAGRKSAESPQEICAYVDLHYHLINKEGLGHKLRRRFKNKCIVTDEDIARAIENPPGDTRAKIRGSLIKKFCVAPFPYFINDIGWDFVRIGSSNSDSDTKVYEYSDPLVTHYKWASVLLSRSPKSLRNRRA